jgi:rare lipoprotein A
MISKMRSSATHKLVAAALTGLLASGPAQAVTVEQPVSRIQSLIETVTLLEDVQLPIAAAPAEEPRADLYRTIGEGEASYYGAELAGNRTASGERFNPNAMTAAHRSLPLGTKLRVTNKANGKSVLVRINDRGPFAKSRLIDLSLGAAREISMVRAGKAQVMLEVLRTS